MTIRHVIRAIGVTIICAVTSTMQAGGLVIHPGMSRASSVSVYSQFGLIEPHDAPEIADDLRVGWGRARFHWAEIQPHSPDAWLEPELSVDEMDRELEAGREVIGLLIGIPEWARDERGLPRGLYLSHQDRDNTWAQFVREAVSRYRGRVNQWIIWNEPDVWDTNHPGFTWPGDENDYVQLLKVAYQVAHEENSDAVIHLAAVTHWWDALYDRELYFRRLLAALTADPEAAQFDHYYDVATLHIYFNPASVYDLIESYGDIQADYGLDKPIWLVETNAAPSSDPAWTVEQPTFRVSLLEQAAYFPQALALAMAAGAQRIGIYKLIDTPGDYVANPEPFGLVRADGAPRPALQTVEVAMEQLASMEHVEWTDRHVVAQVVASKSGQITRVLWSRVPFAQELEVEAVSESGSLIDMWGNAVRVVPVDGFYTIVLTAGECQETISDYCMIGGPPVYLVEHAQAGQEWRGDDLSLDARPFSGDFSRGEGGEIRHSLIVWLGLSGGILVLAAVGIALRARAARAA